jgi:hypothetical protein
LLKSLKAQASAQLPAVFETKAHKSQNPGSPSKAILDSEHSSDNFWESKISTFGLDLPEVGKAESS